MKSGLKDLQREVPAAVLLHEALLKHQGIGSQPTGDSNDLAWVLPTQQPQFRMWMGWGSVDGDSQMQTHSSYKMEGLKRTHILFIFSFRWFFRFSRLNKYSFIIRGKCECTSILLGSTYYLTELS